MANSILAGAVTAFVCTVALYVSGCHSPMLVRGDTEPTAVHATGEPISAEYDSAGILRLLQSRIDAEQPGMSFQDVITKKMKLSDYFEKIDRIDDGMKVEDLMPSDQAQEARDSDVWVVGFKTQDELDKVGSLFFVPELSPTLQAVPRTIFGADGKAIGLMVFDSWTGNCIAANLTPSDWNFAASYERLVQYTP